MQYEIINPSDPYTFEAEKKEVAALVIFSISTQYSAHAETGKEEDNIPLFFFGGADEWYKETFGRAADEAFQELKQEVSKALSTVMFGHFEDRRRYNAALAAITDEEKRKAFIDEWQDGISSMNNIGGYCHKLAEKIKTAM